MKIKVFYFLIATAMLVFMGCSDKDNPNKPPKDDDNLQSIELIIGKWKLVEVRDYLNPVNNRLPDYAIDIANAVEILPDSMYLLSFDNDSLLSGKSFSNCLFGTYTIDNNSNLCMKVGGTRICEYGDGSLYHQALNQVHKYFILKTNPLQLELFYNNEKNGLLFVKLE